ncbi:hypothetical protein CEUSTIGMA_g9236.t1 [Chlamydomonas eustigma]|uniref:Uncharacterized protein n=1 Tax=Chlamydomonas eustigma TaxID=1157962 RepID=A0A250XFE2_9CHLO|nr:hypothetical protein CEUSTIGMA_g9236.t1 [Chlamydomonas eustigma]|eukprot:GAX81808.1 hypothetical protein CEUSTIGMA_g9236.t1 [Chlamydomonas eustigma]
MTEIENKPRGKQKITVVTVDNSASCRKVLPTVFPHLGEGLFKGDSGIKLDFMHFLALIRDHSNSNHPSLQFALDELSKMLQIVHPDDAKDDSISYAQKRKLRPPPHSMLPKFLAWINKWSEMGVDARTNIHMFTIQTFRLFKRQIRQICEWQLSDPWVMVDEVTCLPVDMYCKAANGKFLSFKETSIVESQHHVVNTLQRTVGSDVASPQLREIAEDSGI